MAGQESLSATDPLPIITWRRRIKSSRKRTPSTGPNRGPIYRYPINGAIATPGPNVAVPAGWLDLSGYVLPTGRPGSTAKRIQVSADNGVTWELAQGLGKTSEYCWQLWKARVKVTPRTEAILLRAYDNSGGFMPFRVPWNAKGYLQNSWYRLPIRVS